MTADLGAVEAKSYNDLAGFFKHYYQDGDFLSLHRYKKDVYAIPYEGEKVKLHWANTAQYYVKSSEAFEDYTYYAPDYRRRQRPPHSFQAGRRRYGRKQ